MTTVSSECKQPTQEYNEDDLAMISALQHYLFCPRQCALIHIEQQWLENRLTAKAASSMNGYMVAAGNRGEPCGWNLMCPSARCGWG